MIKKEKKEKGVSQSTGKTPKSKTVKKKQPKYVAFTDQSPKEDFEVGDMTISQFQEWLLKKHPVTGTGTPVKRGYVHTLLSYGHLPKKMGGFKLHISMVRDIIVVRVTENKHKFNIGSGKVSEGQKIRGPKTK